MSFPENKIPLGAVLQQAGLVTADLVQEALQQQRQLDNSLKIGEILASWGYIRPQTADFFAEDWFNLIKSESKQPIGQYLKQAALLNEQQIQSILTQQKQSHLKFGELAIARGWLKPVTLDFFLRYLSPQSPQETQPQSLRNQVRSPQQIHQDFYKIKLRLFNLEHQETYSEEVLEKVLIWTGGQSFLTQKVCQLIADHQDSSISGQKAEAVDYLVQTKLLPNWREQALGEHLQGLENRLLFNQQVELQQLLRVYQEILTTEVPLDNSPAQQELLNMGLVVKQQGKLIVANRIYQLVFNPSWINQHLNQFDNSNQSAIALAHRESSSLALLAAPPAKSSSWRFKNWLLLLALLSLLFAFLQNIVKRIQINTAFKQGNEFLQQQNYEQAILEYDALLKIDSNYFQAWTNRGYALAGLQQYGEMRESCTTATIINPNAVYAWNCQGEALHNLQQPAEAVAAFERAIALNSQDPIFLINKSESLKDLDQDAESLMTIKEAIALLEAIETKEGKKNLSGEFAVALTFLGNGYRKQEQYELAIVNYDRALEYSPNYFPAQIGKGIVLSRAKRYQEAQQELETILKNQQLSPGQKAQTWFYLGKTLCNSQQYESGFTAFERAIQLKPDYQAAQQAQQECVY